MTVTYENGWSLHTNEHTNELSANETALDLCDIGEQLDLLKAKYIRNGHNLNDTQRVEQAWEDFLKEFVRVYVSAEFINKL